MSYRISCGKKTHSAALVLYLVHWETIIHDISWFYCLEETSVVCWPEETSSNNVCSLHARNVNILTVKFWALYYYKWHVELEIWGFSSCQIKEMCRKHFKNLTLKCVERILVGLKSRDSLMWCHFVSCRSVRSHQVFTLEPGNSAPYITSTQ